MKTWHGLLSTVLAFGTLRQDRTGVGTSAVFGAELRFDTSKSFPAVTTKKLAFKQVAAELACFTHGLDSLESFHELGCTIWDGNGASDYWSPKQRFKGDLGRIYGVQWRDWQSVARGDSGQPVVVDQLQQLVDGLKKDPHSRRHIVTAWNPGELDQMCLPPCHILFQCYVVDGRLDLRVDMRSVDLFLGLPFDIASYALLLALIAKEVGLTRGELIFHLGDAHIYLNHQNQVRTVLERTPLELPQLVLSDDATLFNFLPHQAALVGYDSHDAVAAPLNI